MDCSLPGSVHGFSRQEYQSGLLFPSPGDLPDTGIAPGSLASWAEPLPSEPPGKGHRFVLKLKTTLAGSARPGQAAWPFRLRVTGVSGRSACIRPFPRLPLSSFPTPLPSPAASNTERPSVPLAWSLCFLFCSCEGSGSGHLSHEQMRG